MYWQDSSRDSKDKIDRKGQKGVRSVTLRDELRTEYYVSIRWAKPSEEETKGYDTTRVTKVWKWASDQKRGLIGRKRRKEKRIG